MLRKRIKRLLRQGRCTPKEVKEKLGDNAEVERELRMMILEGEIIFGVHRHLHLPR